MNHDKAQLVSQQKDALLARDKPTAFPLLGASALVRYVRSSVWEYTPLNFESLENEDHDEGILPDVISQIIHDEDPDEEFNPIFFDTHALLERFLQLETIPDFWFFLQRCGPFVRDSTTDPRGRTHFSIGDLMRWQDYFRSWRLQGWKAEARIPDTTTQHDLMGIAGYSRATITPAEVVGLDPQKTSPIVAVFECKSAVQAMAATVQLDIMRGIRWRRCLHCPRLFTFQDNRKLYCDHSCAHAAGQRKRRASKNRVEFTMSGAK